MSANNEVGPEGVASAVDVLKVPPFDSGSSGPVSKQRKRNKRTIIEPTPILKNIVGRGPIFIESGTTSVANPTNGKDLGQTKDPVERRNVSKPEKKVTVPPLHKEPPTKPSTTQHGIKTSMHVKVISPNHLHLMDKEEPPNINVDTPRMEGEDGEHSHMDESDEDDIEDVESIDMVEETPTHRDI